MQPWAALIVHGVKDVENRSWPTSFRGPVLIHAGKKWDDDAQDAVEGGIHPVTFGPLDVPEGCTFQRGGIIGVAEIVDCVSASNSPWFVGEYGFVIRNARPIPFLPCRGALGFFKPDFDAGYAAKKPARKPAETHELIVSAQTDLFSEPLHE